VAAPPRRLRRYDDDDGDGGDWRQHRRHGAGGDTSRDLLLAGVGGLLGLGTLIFFGLRSMAGAVREGAAAGNNIAGAVREGAAAGNNIAAAANNIATAGNNIAGAVREGAAAVLESASIGAAAANNIAGAVREGAVAGNNIGAAVRDVTTAMDAITCARAAHSAGAPCVRALLSLRGAPQRRMLWRERAWVRPCSARSAGAAARPAAVPGLPQHAGGAHGAPRMRRCGRPC
jgi:hypothetical protein